MPECGCDTQLLLEGTDPDEDAVFARIAAEARAHMLDAYPSPKGMYQPGDGNSEVYWLKNAAAQIGSFAQAPKIIEF